MHAATPKDELQHFGAFVALPPPKYAIGTPIDLSRLSASDYAYYRRRIIRETLRRTRTILNSLQAKGFLKGMTGKKMLPGNKAQLREQFAILANPDSVELAGMKPQSMHVSGSVANQCYLRKGQCHSGVSYSYYLLFRKEVAGNQVVYLHPEAVLDEAYIPKLLGFDEARTPT